MKLEAVEGQAVLMKIISALMIESGATTSPEEMNAFIRMLNQKTGLPLQTVSSSLEKPLRIAQENVHGVLTKMQTVPPSEHE